jgi:hypothetical protein
MASLGIFGNSGSLRPSDCRGQDTGGGIGALKVGPESIGDSTLRDAVVEGFGGPCWGGSFGLTALLLAVWPLPRSSL